MPTHCRCRGYCCSWSESLSLSRVHVHAHTHTHARCRTSLDNGLGLCRGLSTWQCTVLRTDNHSCPQWDSNLQSQQAVATDLRQALDQVATSIGCIFFMFNVVELAHW